MISQAQRPSLPYPMGVKIKGKGNCQSRVCENVSTTRSQCDSCDVIPLPLNYIKLLSRDVVKGTTRRLPLTGTTDVTLLSTRNLALRFMSFILFHEGMANRHLRLFLAAPCICRICPDVRMCRLRFDPLIRPSLECRTPLQPLHWHLNRLRLVWSMAPWWSTRWASRSPLLPGGIT